MQCEFHNCAVSQTPGDVPTALTVLKWVHAKCHNVTLIRLTYSTRIAIQQIQQRICSDIYLYVSHMRDMFRLTVSTIIRRYYKKM